MLEAANQSSDIPIRTHYDYILTGGGASGFSLAVRMALDPWFDDKTVLIIDRDDKNSNDRTWCFWEKEKSIFDEIVFYSWSHLLFYDYEKPTELEIAPYQYKMIRGIDFYIYCKKLIRSKRNFNIIKDSVNEIISDNEHNCTVVTTERKYQSKYIFNSILWNIPQDFKPYFSLKQHFKGWFIETGNDEFDPKTASFMDFRVDQNKGTSFVYLLPIGKRKALVEYTFFNENLLNNEQYDTLLHTYIQNYTNISSFKIIETEYGVIPMSDYPFKRNVGNMINIGTAGGWTKASSGFTFQFIQKKSDEIINKLKKGEFPSPKRRFRDKIFAYYDSVLLNILQNRRMDGKTVFSSLFLKCKATHVFQFLDNEGGLLNDLRIIISVPKTKFLLAGIQELFKKIIRIYRK